MNAPVRNLVSAIVPVFNRAGMLPSAVEAVVAQTHGSVEVIVVDDASTDETPNVCAELAARHPGIVRTHRQTCNRGPGAARNLGLEHARGEFIQYLDSDDWIHPRKFELQVARLREDPGAGVAYCVSERRDATSGTTRVWARTAERIERIFPDFLIERGWDTNSPLWRRSVCDAIGPWGDTRVLEDWEHDLRAGLLDARPVHVPERLVIVNDHGGSRASGMQTGFTTPLVRDFFRAHRTIWQVMKERSLDDWAYLAQFSRKMFWIARLCGERGLVEEADEALSFASEMASTHHVPVQIRMFALTRRVLGWRRTVAIGEGLRQFARRGRGHAVA